MNLVVLSFFLDFELNCRWVGVKSPKLFYKNMYDIYMAYLTILRTYIFHEKIEKYAISTSGVLNPWDVWMGGGSAV